MTVACEFPDWMGGRITPSGRYQAGRNAGAEIVRSTPFSRTAKAETLKKIALWSEFILDTRQSDYASGVVDELTEYVARAEHGPYKPTVCIGTNDKACSR